MSNSNLFYFLGDGDDSKAQIEEMLERLTICQKIELYKKVLTEINNITNTEPGDIDWIPNTSNANIQFLGKRYVFSTDSLSLLWSILDKEIKRLGPLVPLETCGRAVGRTMRHPPHSGGGIKKHKKKKKTIKKKQNK